MKKINKILYLRKACEKSQKTEFDILEIIDLLKDPGLDINFQDEEFGSVFSLVRENSDKDNKIIFEFLKREDFDVNIREEYGYTPLILSCIYNPELVPKLLKHPNINVNMQNSLGNTALMFACMRCFKNNKYIENIKHLLSFPNIDTTLQNYCGHEVLMNTCLYNPEAVSELFKYLDTKDNLLIKDFEENNVFDVAKKRNNGSYEILLSCIEKKQLDKRFKKRKREKGIFL